METGGAKKKAIILFAGLCVIVVCLLGYVFYSAFFSSYDVTDTNPGVKIELPDGDVEFIEESKSAAYRGVKKGSVDAYFAELEVLDAADDMSLLSYSKDSSGQKDGLADGVSVTSLDDVKTIERVFGGVVPSVDDLAEQRMVPRTAVYSATRSMSVEEKLEYDRKRAEMLRDVLAGTSGNEGIIAEAPNDMKSSEPVDVYASRNDDIVFTMDDNVSKGVAEIDGVKKPFRCMFVNDCKLVSGQRVMVRLLEDYESEGVRIPTNTHLAAICKISDRLELSVRSFEMNGHIIPLALDAYDIDGLLGVYCPETAVSKNSQKATNDAVTMAGSTFGGLVGNIANTVIRTGASIVRSISGDVSVNVNSGYEFFLVQSDRK